MPRPSLPDAARLADLHARFPATLRPLMGHANGLLRRGGAPRVGGHLAERSTPAEQAKSDSRSGGMVEKLAAG